MSWWQFMDTEWHGSLFPLTLLVRCEEKSNGQRGILLTKDLQYRSLIFFCCYTKQALERTVELMTETPWRPCHEKLKFKLFIAVPGGGRRASCTHDKIYSQFCNGECLPSVYECRKYVPLTSWYGNACRITVALNLVLNKCFMTCLAADDARILFK